MYEVLGVARHSETGEFLIVYKGLYDHPERGRDALNVRPVKMFLETVEHEGRQIPRFQFLHSVDDVSRGTGEDK